MKAGFGFIEFDDPNDAHDAVKCKSPVCSISEWKKMVATIGMLSA